MASYVSTFTGDGSEVHFTAGFPVLRLTDLAVVVDNVWLTLGTDYSVAGPTSAAVATLATAPAVGAVVTLRSAVGYTPTDPAAVTTAAPNLNDTDTALWEALNLRVQAAFTAEAAARAAADAAIIASADEPANVSLAPVIATGSIQARTVATRFGDWVNVLDFGADPTGVADSTTAIQAAIDAASTLYGSVYYCKTVFFPPGEYKVSDTLAATNSRGLWLVGTGVEGTQIVPTIALAGKPMVLFTDCRNGGVEKLRFYGESAGAPDCAIQFDTLATRAVTPMYMTVRDVSIGSASANSLTFGCRVTASADYDANNEQFLFENVDFNNILTAGISIEHSNSLLHDIIHCSFTNVAGAAVKTGGTGAHPGGSFRMFGGAVINCGYAWDLTGEAYYNNIVLHGVTVEQGDFLLKTDGDWRISIRDCTFVGGGGTAYSPLIQLLGTGNGQVLIIDGGSLFTDAGWELDAAAAARAVIQFTGCYTNCRRIKFDGQLTTGPNYYTSGLPTIVKSSTTSKHIDLAGLGASAPTGGQMLAGANTYGTFTVSDTASTAALTFGQAEPNTSYYIIATAYDYTGTPDPLSRTIAYLNSKTTAGCTIGLGAAPGAGDSVSFVYQVVRIQP
jgi:hypothetical protein